MRRIEWVIGALLAVFLVLGLGVLFVYLTNDEPARPTARPVQLSGEVSAQTAYEQAAILAGNWAEDAQLVNARANWQEGQVFESGQADWGFVFYSGNKEATILIAVVLGSTRQLNTQKVEQRPALINENEWQIDSETAVETLLDFGAASFIRDAGGASLNLILTSVDGRPVWNSTFIAAETRRVLTIQLDAQSGEILDFNQSQ